MVEAWLQGLVEGMQGTMKTLIRRAARSVNEMGLQDFLFGHPAQIALLGLQFQWTADTQARCTRGSCRRSRGICFARQFYGEVSPMMPLVDRSMHSKNEQIVVAHAFSTMLTPIISTVKPKQCQASVLKCR